jgi:hypothetical protein
MNKIKLVRGKYYVMVQGKHTKHVDKVVNLDGRVMYISKCLYTN